MLPEKKGAEVQRCGYNDRNVMSAPGATLEHLQSIPQRPVITTCVPKDWAQITKAWAQYHDPQYPRSVPRIQLRYDGHLERGRTGA